MKVRQDFFVIFLLLVILLIEIKSPVLPSLLREGLRVRFSFYQNIFPTSLPNVLLVLPITVAYTDEVIVT
jgi:hypothetical protein